MNHLIASTYDASRGINLPSRRVEGGRKLTDLLRYGVEIIGEVDQQGFQHCILPAGWRPVAVEASSMQLEILDENDTLRAKIYYKPASQGGGASMEIIYGMRLFAGRWVAGCHRVQAQSAVAA